MAKKVFFLPGFFCGLGRAGILALLCLALAPALATAEAEPWAWIWYPGEWQKSYREFFARRTFQIEADVQRAWLFYSGDNFVTLYLNGQVIGRSGDWYSLKPITIETLGPLLKPGRNLLAVHVKNDDYEGGFILKGALALSNGVIIDLASNSQWRCTNKQTGNWETIDFDDAEWIPAERIGTPPAGNWGTPTMPPSWQPVGILDVGDAGSEKEFNYAGQGQPTRRKLKYADGTEVERTGGALTGGERFTVPITAQGFLVLERRVAAKEKAELEVSCDGRRMGLWPASAIQEDGWSDSLFVLPEAALAGKKQVVIELAPKPAEGNAAVSQGETAYTSFGYEFFITNEWYFLGEKHCGPVLLPRLIEQAEAQPADGAIHYLCGLAHERVRAWAKAQASYQKCAAWAGSDDLGQMAKRRSRQASAYLALGGGANPWEVAWYLKLNHFHAQAERLFAETVRREPENAAARDQLGECMLFAGRPIDECIAVWKHALRQRPARRPNRWKGVITLSPKGDQVRQVEVQKRELERMRDLIECSSRGSMALDAKVIVDPPPVEQLFKVGEMDTYITISGGAGGGSTLGPDVSYGHAGWSGFGFVTSYDVCWHEWIHQLECGLASSWNGQGWPGCHSSTQFGYRPPWPRWYHNSMRYYITPGQFERVCIADHLAAPPLDHWLVAGPFPTPDVMPHWICHPGKKDAPEFFWRARKKIELGDIPASATVACTVDDRYVVFVNGQRIGHGASWAVAEGREVRNALRQGVNVIAIAAKNDGWSGALLASIDLVQPDGSVVVLPSDGSWRSSPGDIQEFNAVDQGKTPDWAQADFDDAAWEASEIVGTFPCAPWGRIRIPLRDRVMTTNFNVAGLEAPAENLGWKPVKLDAEGGVLSRIAPSELKEYVTLTYAFTYVYCPAGQRVQVSLGSSYRANVGINGEWVREVGGSGYPTLPKGFPARLSKGWNRILLKLEDIGRNGRFWMKIAQPGGEAIAELRSSSLKPEGDLVPDQTTLPRFDRAQPAFYRWRDVRDDPYELLPRLIHDDLRALTGYAQLAVSAGNNFLFVDIGKDAEPIRGYRPLASYQGGESLLNNALTWDDELCLLVRYRAKGGTRDLLILKPEAYEPLFETELLQVEPAAGRPLGDSILGWILENGRIGLVVDTRLGPLPEETIELLALRD